MGNRNVNAPYNVIPNVVSGGCSTCSSTIQPHPVWSDLTGGTATQMNMVTIGGNGLNS
jgi:hypothetical protein